MSNLLKYPALNAKMKGMYSKTLTKEDLEELMKQSTMKDAISYLKAKFSNLENLNEEMDRKTLEQELNNLFIIDILKLYKYLDKSENEIFTQFILKYKLNCVKNVFRNLTTNREVKTTLKNIDNWTTKIFSSIENINNVNNEEEFFEVIKKEKYFDIFSEYKEIIENAPLEEIEVELDKYYFKEIYNYSKKTNSELEDIVGREIDLLNIVWIYRAKMYFQYSPDEINEILIPINYKINKKKIRQLTYCNDFEEITKALDKTPYKDVFKEESNIERDKNKYLYDIYLKYFRTELFNISTVFCYINLLDREIKNITNIIEGIRYNIDIREIQKKIIV